MKSVPLPDLYPCQSKNESGSSSRVVFVSYQTTIVGWTKYWQYNMASRNIKKSKQQQRDDARKWAKGKLAGNNKTAAAKKKPMSAASKAEAKARARKWAKERFGETSNDSLLSDEEDEDDEINTGFCRMGID